MQPKNRDSFAGHRTRYPRGKH